MFDVLDDLECALDKASRSEVPIDVARLRMFIDRAEALWVRSVGEAERAGEWQAEGFVSSAAWLREKCRLTHGDAASAVKLSRTLDAMPALAEAFAAGEISRQHAQVVSCARTPERRAVFDELDETLTNAARTLKPHDLRRVVQRATDAIDGDGGASRDRAQYAQRGLHISDGLDGTAYGAMTLEPEGREVLLTALDAVMATERDANDTRTYSQKQYDALIDLARVAMAHIPDGPGRHRPAHLLAVFDICSREEIDPELAVTLRCEAAHGPISRSTLERWGCDCKVSRVIADGSSEVLDVGRASYTATAAQWAALVVRDGGCVEPGCDRGPGWCDVHHKDLWDNGGETNIDNLELRCRRHHRAIHRRGP